MSERLTTAAAGLARAATLLRQGAVIALPTESSWGLAVDALDKEALARLWRLKGRPAGQPPPVGILGQAMLDLLVANVPETARRLMAAHWPGPLTLVLAARPGLPAALVAHGQVGVRESPHPVVRMLLEAYGRPITLTSANRSGAAPAQRAAELQLEVDAVLEGEAGGAPPSTVARVGRDGTIEVLRPGPVVP